MSGRVTAQLPTPLAQKHLKNRDKTRPGGTWEGSEAGQGTLLDPTLCEQEWSLGSSGCSCGCCGFSSAPHSWAGLGSTPPLLFSSVLQHQIRKDAAQRNGGKTVAERGWLCKADPNTCIPPPLSPWKDCNSATTGPGSLLKPYPHQDMDGTELNSARNSTPFLYNPLPQKYLLYKKRNLFPFGHNQAIFCHECANTTFLCSL